MPHRRPARYDDRRRVGILSSVGWLNLITIFPFRKHLSAGTSVIFHSENCTESQQRFFADKQRQTRQTMINEMKNSLRACCIS
jgi:hypothetical protein